MTDPNFPYPIVQTERLDKRLKQLTKTIRTFNEVHLTDIGKTYDQKTINFPRLKGKVCFSSGVLGNFHDVWVEYLIPRCSKQIDGICLKQ